MNAVLLAIALLQVSASNGSLRGGVWTADNRPLFAAAVEIEGPQGSLVTRTDSQGQFAFTNLPPGPYRVFAKKEGYVRQEVGQTKPGGSGKPVLVSPGGRIQDLVFRLKPAATIAGTVRNNDGFAIANILVRAMRRTYDARGNSTVTLFSSALTDDLGAFRLYWLDAGDYAVDASYLPQLPTAVNANESAKRVPYARTYYPGVADAAAASVLHLANGELADRIDFRLQRSVPVQVRGTIYSILTRDGVPARVTLTQPEAGGNKPLHTVQTDAKGAFEIRGVNPGSYVLSATSLSADGQTAFSKIEVGDVDSSADLVIGPGIQIPIRLSGEVPPSADLRAIEVSLAPKESFMPLPVPSVVQPNGALVLPNVQPGEYLLRVVGLPGNTYVRSAQIDARDVLEQFVEAHYERVFPLDIQLAFDGGQLSGSVIDAAGKASGATVALVPDKAFRHRLDQYRVVMSEASGRFSILGIPPGSYKLFAWESIETGAWLNPEFMVDYEDVGIPVTIGLNEKLNSSLRLIPEKR